MAKIINFAKHHKKITIITAIIFIIIIIIFWPRPPKNVLTEQVKMSDITKTVSVTGNIDADNTVNLSFQIPGTLSYLGIKEDSIVKANQVIATLDQRTAQKNLENALISYSEQRNTFDQTIANNNGVSKPNDALNDTMKRLLEDNQYDLNKTILSVELDDLVKQESVLTTPISGIVTRADTQISGVNVTPATIFTITDPNSLNFKMEVDEADIGQINIGQKVTVSLDAFSNDNLNIYVDKIDFASHTTTSGGNAFYVEAKIPNNKNYRVGMNGNADIIVDSRQKVLTISSSSVLDDTYVYEKIKNGFIKKKVSLGLQNDTQAEVLNGLTSGDIVALDPSSIPLSMVIKQ